MLLLHRYPDLIGCLSDPFVPLLVTPKETAGCGGSGVAAVAQPSWPVFGPFVNAFDVPQAPTGQT